MSRLTHNVSAQADELLDHIYEYGTNSEGVIPRINQLCDAAVEQLRAELAASREREARGGEAVSDRHEMQAAGTHPAPCARHCESTAYEIEIRRLRAELAASREREARMRAQRFELLGVITDVEQGDGFDDVCLMTLKRVAAALAEGAQG